MGHKPAAQYRGVNSCAEGLIDDAERLILKIESSPFRRRNKREGDYVSHVCLRQVLFIPSVLPVTFTTIESRNIQR